MGYSLTLSKGERDAIDWVGHRYRHGDELYKLLWLESDPTDMAWDDDADITFHLPEHVAWEVAEIIDEGLDCFADELREKLYTFRNRIV